MILVKKPEIKTVRRLSKNYISKVEIMSPKNIKLPMTPFTKK